MRGFPVGRGAEVGGGAEGDEKVKAKIEEWLWFSSKGPKRGGEQGNKGL